MDPTEMSARNIADNIILYLDKTIRARCTPPESGSRHECRCCPEQERRTDGAAKCRAASPLHRGGYRSANSTKEAQKKGGQR